MLYAIITGYSCILNWLRSSDANSCILSCLLSRWSQLSAPFYDLTCSIEFYTCDPTQFTFTNFCPFLTTYLPPVYNHLHLTNHLPTVNVYIWELTTLIPKTQYVQYLPQFVKICILISILRVRSKVGSIPNLVVSNSYVCVAQYKATVSSSRVYT